ncbi:hypothetical protein A2442_01025 [Candidatus Campbellbacteria bacterium RIFOXYC2_FULL_35_25]|uniref:Transposase IS200-like domain-containing protein n=1 Tax=Candidatus Campbellbacteria bacterium RIFOXYC2_FULL_35_25 TaxID=1797582 RepID=A0A1F5EIV2_9BACT|nr:MAG: hypothetical protein A2442_01025 [Candidatus Campbellbacteria bacterium RIFOXYC2_FULL_35_25]
MGIRNIIFSEGEFYHIYNRGTDKRIIFDEKRDYLRFITLLYLCNNTEKIHINEYAKKGFNLLSLLKVQKENTLVEIGAYCLMPNHFHLLIREKVEGGISNFMQKLATAYSMYYNSKYQRTGSLFEGKFKATHVAKDNYLEYLFAYIHLNPVKLIDSKWKENGIKDKKKTKKFLENYEYSSYLDFIGKNNRIEEKILDGKNFPNYFETFEEFNKFVDEWLSFEEEK